MTQIYSVAKISGIILVLFFSLSAWADSIKLFYSFNGVQGYKGGYSTIEQCEKSARSNRYSPTDYYCSDKQNYELERRLGWRK
jgi:hypothetical protein